MATNNKNGNKDNPEDIKINDKFLADLIKMQDDAEHGIDIFDNIDKIDRARLSIEADRVILEGNPKADSLNTFELALLRTEVFLLKQALIILHDEKGED